MRFIVWRVSRWIIEKTYAPEPAIFCSIVARAVAEPILQDFAG